MGTVEDVAHVVSFMASEKAGWVTGKLKLASLSGPTNEVGQGVSLAVDGGDSC